MANTLFHLLVIFLSLSHFFIFPSSNASRVGSSFVDRPNVYQPRQDNMLLDPKEKRSEEEMGHEERMVVEINDYPGSGANNRHVPRQQFGRGCIDC